MSETTPTNPELTAAIKRLADYLDHPDGELGRIRGRAFTDYADLEEAESHVRNLGEGGGPLLMLAQMRVVLVQERIDAAISAVEGYFQERGEVITIVEGEADSDNEESYDGIDTTITKTSSSQSLNAILQRHKDLLFQKADK